MPIVDVHHRRDLPAEELSKLARLLPDLVAEAVDCPEEPWVGPPQPGDIDVRFHQRGEHDVGYLPLTVEIRTKWFRSRVLDKQRRADLVKDGLADAGFREAGVWLILLEGVWSQD